ncbi:DUF4131 domain-containing protein [Candidatus Dojkabacteria bacterium]|nr:DUF4131 domain-containing protein [Candidatus Dojkabacteria bacterium]
MNLRTRIKLFNYILRHSKELLFLFGFSFGIFIYDNTLDFIFPSIINYSGLILTFFLVILVFLPKQRMFVLIFCISFIIGFLRTNLFYSNNIYGAAKYYETSIRMQGKIISQSVIKKNGIEAVVFLPRYGKVLLKLPRYPVYNYGDQLLISGVLKEPPVYDSFSYKRYLQVQKINYIMRTPEITFINTNNKGVIGKTANFRNSLIQRIELLLPEPHSGLLQGLVLGVRAYIPEKLGKSLQITGTTHIIAVSGYNVSLVVLSLMRLTKIISRKKLSYLVIIALIFFLFLVGLDNIPAFRAVFMGIVFIIAQLVGRKGSIMKILILAVIYFLLMNPLVYRSISFQLTIMATIGIVGLSHMISEVFYFVPKLFREELSATIAAIICTSPITLSSFNSFSIIAPISNLMILPFISLITNLGILMLGISFLSLKIASAISWFVWLGLEYIIIVIRFFGEFEGMFLENVFFSIGNMLIVYVVLIIFLFELHYRRVKRKSSPNIS